MRTWILLAALVLLPLASAQPEVDLEVTGAEAKGGVEGVGAFSGLLHERGDVPGLSSIGFDLAAQNMSIVRDAVTVVAAAGVVAPVTGAEHSSVTTHSNATAEGFARKAGHLLAVLPTGPVAATVSGEQARMAPVTGSIQPHVFVESGRTPPTADVSGSALLDVRGGVVTLEGDFLIVFWDWTLAVEDAEGVHEYRSGRVASERGPLVPAEHGEMVQHYVFVEQAILRLALPEDRPSGLYLHGSRWSEVETLRLDGALGSIAGRSLNGQDVTLEGDALDVKLGGSGADYFPVRVTGDITQAHIAQETVPLAAVAAVDRFTGAAAWAVGVLIVVVASIAVARAGRRGPYDSRWLNLSEHAFERAWARPMLLFATLHLRRHKGSPDGWKLKTNALQALGRARPEIKAREAAARFLQGTHRVHNAMRLVILHARSGDVEAAMVWLRRCKQMDPQGTQRLGISELAADLGRDARFRAAAGQVLGLDPLGA